MDCITLSVIFSTTFNAFKLSFNCSTFEAPVITVLTFLFFKHQANAKCGKLVFKLFASVVIFFAFSILSFAVSPIVASFNHSIAGRFNRVSVGMPLLYFPVSNPDASGDQMVVPKPISEYKRSNSTSNLSR